MCMLHHAIEVYFGPFPKFTAVPPFHCGANV